MARAAHFFGRLRRRLDPFLTAYEAAVREDQRPVLRATLLSLLSRPAPYASEVARRNPQLGPTLQARERRVVRFLASPRLDLAALEGAHRDRVRRRLPRKRLVPLYADISDISKPWARRLEALDRVRDGSDPGERTNPGYWLNEIYAVPRRGRILPVVFEVFSLKAEGTGSQNEVILDGIDAAFGIAGDLGVLVADRGYDSGEIFKALLPKERLFVIRLQAGSNSRLLRCDDSDAESTVQKILEGMTLLQRLDPDEKTSRPGRGQLGWRTVRLPAHPETELTLVVFQTGYREPLVLLTSLAVPDFRAARRVVRLYLDRWAGAEDPIRFLKQSFRLEKVLFMKLRALRAWAFLVAITMGILTALMDAGTLARALVGQVEWFRERVDLAHYRLARTVARILELVTPRRWRDFATSSSR